MLISHIIKTIEYFLAYGFPEITLEDLPTLFNYALKLIHIYMMYFAEILS
jgi:hypothetical protein